MRGKTVDKKLKVTDKIAAKPLLLAMSGKEIAAALGLKVRSSFAYNLKKDEIIDCAGDIISVDYYLVQKRIEKGFCLM